jgi:hypothetical protein
MSIKTALHFSMGFPHAAMIAMCTNRYHFICVLALNCEDSDVY